MRISDWSSDGALPICRAPRRAPTCRRPTPCLAASAQPCGASRDQPQQKAGADIDGERAIEILAARRVRAVADPWFVVHDPVIGDRPRSEEHTSELQSLMRISYAVFCLKKKTIPKKHNEESDIIQKH